MDSLERSYAKNRQNCQTNFPLFIRVNPVPNNPGIPGFGKIPSRKIPGLKFLIPLGPDKHTTTTTTMLNTLRPLRMTSSSLSVYSSSSSLSAFSASSSSGPRGIKIFNPGIFRDRILPNPGIPGFFGTGFTFIKSEKYFCQFCRFLA